MYCARQVKFLPINLSFTINGPQHSTKTKCDTQHMNTSLAGASNASLSTHYLTTLILLTSYIIYARPSQNLRFCNNSTRQHYSLTNYIFHIKPLTTVRLPDTVRAICSVRATDLLVAMDQSIVLVVMTLTSSTPTTHVVVTRCVCVRVCVCVHQY
jgi:hypothetical protein